jgi:hypothetical protein
MMEAVNTSETSVYFNETTWSYMPETHFCKNLKSHNFKCLVYTGVKFGLHLEVGPQTEGEEVNTSGPRHDEKTARWRKLQVRRIIICTL